MAISSAFGNAVSAGPSSSWTTTSPAKFGNSGEYSMPNGGPQKRFGEAQAAWAALGYSLDPHSGSVTKTNAGTDYSAPVGSAGTTSTINGMFGGTVPAASSEGSSTTALIQGNRFDEGLTTVEQRLKELISNPDSIQQTGAYKFRVKQGEDALQRNLGARGMLNSGNRLMELLKYGQDMGSQEYDAQAQRLGSLLGNYTTAWNANDTQNVARQKNAWAAATDRENAITARYGAETNRALGNLKQTEYDNTWSQQQKDSRKLSDLIGY